MKQMTSIGLSECSRWFCIVLNCFRLAIKQADRTQLQITQHTN